MFTTCAEVTAPLNIPTCPFSTGALALDSVDSVQLLWLPR